jgi:hypothetical protein
MSIEAKMVNGLLVVTAGDFKPIILDKETAKKLKAVLHAMVKNGCFER